MANKVDLNKVKEALKRQKAKKSKSGINWWKPEEGTNIIRILPPWGKEGTFAKEAGYHYGIKSDGPVGCSEAILGQPCLACKQAKALFKSRRSGDVQLAKRIAVKKRYFYNVLDRKAKDGKVYVYGSGPGVYEDLLSIFADKDYGDITDVDNGYDVKIIREGEGLETKYDVRPAKDSSPVQKWEKKKKNLVDLDALVSGDCLSEKEMKNLLEGVSEDEDEEEEETEEKDEDESEEEEEDGKESEDEDDDSDDDEEEEKPKKGKKADDEEGGDEEESEDDDDEDEDSDEDDEKSKSKKVKKKKSDDEDEDEKEESDDDDDDEEDDDDDEEEEEKPKKGKKKKDEDEEEDEDSDDDEEEDEEEDDDKPKKGKKGKDEDEEVKAALERLKRMKRKK